jgi:hypothetical protein
MASGIRFFAGSGAMGNTVSSLGTNQRAESGLEIFNYNQNTPFQAGSPVRIGFFGPNGAPSSPVRVGQFQDRTHVCDYLGNNLGILCNFKYADSGGVKAYASGVPWTNASLAADIPRQSGILLRLMTAHPGDGVPSTVQTINGIVRAIDVESHGPVLDFSSSNRCSTVIVYAAQLTDTWNTTGDSNWTKISDGGADLTLNDQLQDKVHDYHIILSASPQTVGANKDFAIYVEIEYF